MNSIPIFDIQLEDISLEGGCFYVYPKSHLEIKESDFLDLNHEEFIQWTNLNASTKKKKNLLLRKGDVMFWHPYLIHGSSLSSLENLSRKSLTAHYFPVNFTKYYHILESGLSMGSLWAIYGLSMVDLWSIYGRSKVDLWSI